MATNYTNNFKNILDRLISIFRDEFKGSLPVYIGKEEPTGTQHLRLIPVGSSLSEYNASSELREYTINFILTFKDVNTTQKGLEQVLRLISRIESTDISELPETGYSVFFVYQCQHLGNLS